MYTHLYVHMRISSSLLESLWVFVLVVFVGILHMLHGHSISFPP